MADNGDADKAKRPATEAGRARSDLQNEWTASDRRGPLSAAEEEAAAEAERVRDAETPPYIPQATSPEPEPRRPSSVDGSQPAGQLENEPASEPPPAGPAQSVSQTEPATAAAPRRHVPVLPIIAALIVGAVIGAASAAIVYKSSDQGASQSDVNALASRLDTMEKRPDPRPELDQLRASLAKVSTQKPAQAAPVFDPQPLQQQLAAVEADIDALKKQDADHSLGDKVAALGTAIADLQAQGADVKGLGDKVAALAGSIDGLKQEDATAKAGIASLQSGQKSLEDRTGAPALAVAADGLVAAIAQGRAYAGEVDALATLGADSAKIAVLRENADKGVPSARSLAAKFAPLADPIIASANRAPPNAGLMDQLKSGMLGMVSIRRSDATAGDDVGSRVSRIDVDLAHDDVAGAYETWNGLPAEAKAKSEAWGALAKTHVTAMNAARALQQQAIAGLGGKKS